MPTVSSCRNSRVTVFRNAPSVVMLPAAILAAGGVRFVVVGSAALWMDGVDTVVHDLDVVPDPAAANLKLLVSSLPCLGVLAGDLPVPGVLGSSAMMTFSTAYGIIDVLVERGREEYPTLARAATPVLVLGVPTAVASASDAWRLRHRFKTGCST